MFTDTRSKSIVFVAHCVLNQNAVSDGTATHGGTVQEMVDFLNRTRVGIVQMPCPELLCLGLDRGNPKGGTSPVVEENSRIRKALQDTSAINMLKAIVENVVFQITEYQKYGFDIRGIVGINRSPSCGVDTTSAHNKEIAGHGLFIDALQKALQARGITIPVIGIKSSDTKRMVQSIRDLIENN